MMNDLARADRVNDSK